MPRNDGLHRTMLYSLTSAWVSSGKLYTARRDESGRKLIDSMPAHYLGYTRTPEAPEFKDGRVLRVHPKSRDGFYEVEWRDYETRKSWLMQHGKNVPTFEADFSPVKRLLADEQIAIAKQRRVYLDIETDSRVPVASAITGEARILMFALVTDGLKVYQNILKDESDEAEAELLFDLWTQLGKFDQVSGWNSDFFDKLVIDERTKYLKLKRDPSLNWIDHLLCYRRMNLQVASSGEEKQSFSLNAVANAVTGQGKDDFETAKTYEAWRAKDPAVAKYNVQDTRLMPLIEKNTGYLDTHQTICEVCHIFPNSHSLKPTPQVDGYLARLVQSKGERLPSRIEQPEGAVYEQIEGAYVMPPQRTGILTDVHVADFSSLYPTCMQSLNLCWTTKSAHGCKAPGTGVHFRQDVLGLIPQALTEFMSNRKIHKDKKKAAVPGSEAWKVADRQQSAYKVLANSTYGILANVHSRYFDRELAESVTLMGQFLIKAVNAEAQVRGMTPLYSDTDSCMITGCTTEEFAAFVNDCNLKVFPTLLKGIGATRNHINLDYVETFERLVFPVADGEPVSKRYVGRFSRYDGKPITDYAIEQKGLEVKRGDGSRLMRAMQSEAIAILMQGWEYVKGETIEEQLESLVIDWRKMIFEGELELDDIAVSRGVKPIGSYARENKNGKPMGLPVQARVALEVFETTGAYPYKAKFVVTDSSTSPQTVVAACNFTGKFDRAYIWRSVYPATMRLLVGAGLNVNWNHYNIKKPKAPPSTEQMSLF